MVAVCLAVKGKIVKLKSEGRVAVVEVRGKRMEALNAVEAKVGERVLVQQGMVVDVL